MEETWPSKAGLARLWGAAVIGPGNGRGTDRRGALEMWIRPKWLHFSRYLGHEHIVVGNEFIVTISDDFPYPVRRNSQDPFIVS